MDSTNLFVMDNLLPLDVFHQCYEELNSFYNPVCSEKYEIQLSSENEPRWSALAKASTVPLEKSLGDSLPLIDLGVRLKYVAKKVIKKQIELTRINTNFQKFGEESCFHTDGPEGFWTFLVFFVQQWDSEWGGDLVINPSQLTYQNVAVIPNRGVLFRSHVPHKGNAPNRKCVTLRKTVACTYREINERRIYFTHSK